MDTYNAFYEKDAEQELKLGSSISLAEKLQTSLSNFNIIDLEKVLVSAASLVAIGTLAALTLIDRKYSSLVTDGLVGNEETLDQLARFADHPPTMVFLSFIIMIIGVDSVLPSAENWFSLDAAIYLVFIWFQASYLVMLVSSVIKELAIEKGFAWLLVVMCSAVLHSLLFPLTKAASHGCHTFLKSFQSWVTALGCLFEICKYSTTNMTSFLTYYGAIEDPSMCTLLTALSVVHVAVMVTLGLVLLAIMISVGVSGDDCDELEDEILMEFTEIVEVVGESNAEKSPVQTKSKHCTWRNPWIFTMFLPFMAVSLYHCEQLQPLQLLH